MVLVFWSYFETRIERLFRETAKTVPKQVMEHLLERNSFVGTRLDRLYNVVFSTTYRADLNHLGCGRVAALLKKVEQRRNRFAHGHPEAIDDALVGDAESVEQSLERVTGEENLKIGLFDARAREQSGAHGGADIAKLTRHRRASLRHRAASRTRRAPCERIPRAGRV